MVGRTGFEPVKAMPVDLQSTPFGHSGTYPFDAKPSVLTPELEDIGQTVESGKRIIDIDPPESACDQ